MKKVIITGGCGFIGSNLIKYLLKKNYFVINIDKQSYSANPYNFRNIKNQNYKFFKADIGNKKILNKILKKYKPEIIFNLAAETHVDRSIDSPDVFVNNNILSFFRFLEIVKKYKTKIKLIHISTDEVFGDLGGSHTKAKENSAYNPSSPYAATKASADHLLKSFIRTYDLNAIITHCSNNYGPNQFPEKFIPKLIFCLLNNKALPIYGKGKNLREWLYVEDHCKALELISIKGKKGEQYNIGSNQNLSNISLVKKIISSVKKRVKNLKNVKIQFVKDRPGHDMRYALNSNKLKQKLNWKPLISIDAGIQKTVDWYLQNKKFFFHIKNKDFKKRLGLGND